MPQEVLSDIVLSAAFFPPRQLRTSQDLLLDYEQGGIALNNTSKGLQYQTWTGQVDTLGNFNLSPASGGTTAVIQVPNVVEWAFTFDQNMNPFFTWTDGTGASWYYWFSPLTNSFQTTELPAGSVNCRCSLDDKRAPNSGTSDIVLAYLRAGTLYMRQQRDRYGTEYTLKTGLTGKRLLQVGLNEILRFQFEITP